MMQIHENYEVDHGTLTLGGIIVNENIGMAGFPTPFGAAPSDDAAHTVVKL